MHHKIQSGLIIPWLLQPTAYNEVTVNWNIAEQQNISQYELQKATVNSIFRRVAIIPVGQDTSYSYTDNDITAWYSLPISFGGDCRGR